MTSSRDRLQELARLVVHWGTIVGFLRQGAQGLMYHMMTREQPETSADWGRWTTLETAQYRRLNRIGRVGIRVAPALFGYALWHFYVALPTLPPSSLLVELAWLYVVGSWLLLVTFDPIMGVLAWLDTRLEGLRPAELAAWPGLVLHEATHAAVGELLGARVDVALDEAVPHVRLVWPGHARLAAVYAAHLAPTILGVLLAAVWGPWLAATLPTMVSLDPFTLAALGLLAAYNWLVYTWPSHDDRHPLERATPHAEPGAGD